MPSLWEVLKTSKGLPAPDGFTALFAHSLSDAYTLAEISGIPPLNLGEIIEIVDYTIYGSTYQAEGVSPDTPREVVGCGDIQGGLRDNDRQIEQYGYKIPVTTKSEDGTKSITTTVYLDKPIYKIGDYADTLCYAEQKAERYIKELVLTGEENFTYDVTYARFTLIIPNARFTSNRSDETPCTHYVSIHDGRSVDDVPDDSIYVTAGGGYVYINIKDTTYTSLADFKSYLASQHAAGTPVKVYYVLATPVTETVELPEIPTLDGTTVIDVDTEVKPSNLKITYKSKM